VVLGCAPRAVAAGAAQPAVETSSRKTGSKTGGNSGETTTPTIRKQGGQFIVQICLSTFSAKLSAFISYRGEQTG